jgi:TolB-like protein
MVCAARGGWGMADFFAELKRRQMFRVAVAYAVVAWLLLQIVNNVAPVLDLPPWVARAFLLALVVGFPIALLFVWMRELPPADSSAPRTATTKLDYVLTGGLVVVIGLLSYQQLAPSAATNSKDAGVEAAKMAAAAPATAISLAVLPFENLSGDSTQEFFSDGMTEEITSTLAKIPDLRVVGRTSAFQFKDERKDLRAIGQALNATHLIEGSVRKAGDHVRITVQLIKSEDGLQIWSESYDRQLTDVFAVQEEIARAVAASFNMRLGLAPGERLVTNRPKDQETYDLYLRGRAAVRQRNREELGLLEQVVARDPNFAPGWAWLGEARREMGLYFQRLGDESKRIQLWEGAETAARKAIALAPAYAGGYSALASVTRQQGQWSEAMDLFKEGLARDPDDPELLNGYAAALTTLGYLKDSLEARERVSLLEPLIPLYNRQRIETLLANGEVALGESQLLLIVRRFQPGPGFAFLAASYAQHGRFAEATDTFDMVLSNWPPAGFTGVYARPLVEAAGQVLRARAGKLEPPQRLPDFFSELNFVYAHTSAPERILDWPENALKERDYRPLLYIWWPTPSGVRKTDRFKTLVRNAGLVDYWRAKGWPDLCRPVGADDFVCD